MHAISFLLLLHSAFKSNLHNLHIDSDPFSTFPFVTNERNLEEDTKESHRFPMDPNRNHNPFLQPPCAVPGGGGGGEVYGMGGTWIMGTPMPPHGHPANQQAATSFPVDHIPIAQPWPYGRNPNEINHNNFSQFPPGGTGGYGGNPSFYPSYPSSTSSNPYVQITPTSGSSGKSSTDVVFKALGQATKKAGGVAGSLWQHLRTSPHPTDAALARLSQGTKVFAEGGQEKIFERSFGIFPGEKLLKTFACYISTSSGPVIGTLYLSTVKIAFCSDNALCLDPNQGQQEWKYYKVVVQLDQLRGVNPSVNRTNPAEKYIQTATMDGHEFWFMGFVSYDKALKNLTEALQNRNRRYY